MKKHSFLFLCLLLIVQNQVIAQKSDYAWLAGYGSVSHNSHDSAINGYTYGNIKLNFNEDPVVITFDSLDMNFDLTNTTYCDNNGNLLFYSNGITVANALNETMENGDSLNAGYVQYVWDTTITTGGYRLPQGILPLQSLVDTNQFYLFHTYSDSLPGTFGNYLYFEKTLVTFIDMSENGGQGKVLYKNQTLLKDTLSAELQATRHGNGRDWWLLVQKRNTNCWYEILLDTTGPHVMSEPICLGETMPNGDIGAACFSPDGSKFAYLCGDLGLSIYDFDRCTGQLSNVRFLAMPALLDSGWFGMGVAISPSSRYLYVSATYYLYQFDLWSNDILGSVDTIARYNGGHFPNFTGIQNLFDMQQLGPDGKIYMSCGNTTPYYHIINNPDEGGTACNFVQNVYMPTLVNSVSNHPNYRLGALTQSQCDSLSTATQDVRDAKEQILKVFPDPANDIVTIDYGFTDWNKGAVSLGITNAIGQTIYTQALPMYSGFQKLDVTQFASGTYTVFIKRNNGIVAVNKLVVVH